MRVGSTISRSGKTGSRIGARVAPTGPYTTPAPRQCLRRALPHWSSHATGTVARVECHGARLKGQIGMARR
eukprot:415578-Alexandrium_andersonii.AAC.1